MVVICLVAGCAPSTNPQATSRSEGFPVRVGTQDVNGLPVELQMDNPLPVEASLKIDERMPVELVVSDNKPLLVEADIKTDSVLPVEVVPNRAIWIIIAAAGLITFFTMLAAIASWRAAVNAGRAKRQ